MFRSVVRLLLLPVRSFLYSMEKMGETFAGLQRMTRESLDVPAPVMSPVFLVLESPPATGQTSIENLNDQAHETALSPCVPRQEAAEGARDGSENETFNRKKEKNTMYLDQDLSGNDVKMVLYSVISVATGIDDTARVLFRWPRMVAFGDDMTAADFTAWVLSMPSTQREVYKTACEVCNPDDDLITHSRPFPCKEPCPDTRKHGDGERNKQEDPPDRCYHPQLSILCDPKFHRVAYVVMGRFAVANIDWNEMQALALGQIVNELRKPRPCPPTPVDPPPSPNPPAGDDKGKKSR